MVDTTDIYALVAANHVLIGNLAQGMFNFNQHEFLADDAWDEEEEDGAEATAVSRPSKVDKLSEAFDIIEQECFAGCYVDGHSNTSKRRRAVVRRIVELLDVEA